jgi:hypothetical protein
MFIEVGVALPLILIMTFGALEYAWAFMKKAEISAAARAGARAASLEDSTLATVQQMVSQQMTTSGFPAGSWNLSIDPSDPSAAFPGDSISVSIVANYSAVSLGGLANWLPLPDIVNGHAVMRKEGDS